MFVLLVLLVVYLGESAAAKTVKERHSRRRHWTKGSQELTFPWVLTLLSFISGLQRCGINNETGWESLATGLVGRR